MSLSLRQKQSLFARLLSELIVYADLQGYEVTLGDAYRSAEEQARLHRLGVGAPPGRSCHEIRLAVDLNLFRDGHYLTSTESHRLLGSYWETLDPLCRWGGRFSRPDGNHYSLTHGGRA